MTSHPDRTHTMEDLVRATGFSARQIRYYITRKLVPGAGERGPNVMYGPETLERLELVRRLKEVRVQPTGRPLTLEEIRVSIESLGDEGATQMSLGTELRVIDTDEVRLESPAMMFSEHVEASRGSTFFKLSPQTHDLADLGPLLRDLESLLSGITTDEPRNDRPAPAAAEEWRRVRIPDIEIQVRIPADTERRQRLERIRRVLERLLERGR